MGSPAAARSRSQSSAPAQRREVGSPAQVVDERSHRRGLGGGRARPGVGREQLDLDGRATEQGRGVEVGVPGPHAEVEPAAGRPDRIALPHGLPGRHAGGGEERVAGPQPVRVPDGDVQRPAHRPGEQDGARPAGPHDGARRGGVLDAPVAGTVGRRRRPEGVGHGRVHGRDVGRAGLRAGRRRRGDEQHDDEVADRHRGPRQPPPAQVTGGRPPPPPGYGAGARRTAAGHRCRWAWPGVGGDGGRWTDAAGGRAWELPLGTCGCDGSPGRAARARPGVQGRHVPRSALHP